MCEENTACFVGIYTDTEPGKAGGEQDIWVCLGLYVIKKAGFVNSCDPWKSGQLVKRDYCHINV